MQTIFPNTPIPGTCLTYLGEAPRRSPEDRHRMIRVRCQCGAEKVIRWASIQHGTTVSCGCVGKRQYIRRHDDMAASMSLETRSKIFTLARKAHESREGLAAWFRTSPAVIDFALRMHQRFLQAAAKRGRKALALLTGFERYWLRRLRKRQWLAGLCRRFGWDAARMYEPRRPLHRRHDPDDEHRSRYSTDTNPTLAERLNALISSDPDLEFSIG